MCILYIAMTLMATPFVHALHSEDELQMGSPKPALYPDTSQSDSASTQSVYGPELSRTTATPALPVVAVDAVVVGEVLGGYNTIAAATWTGAARGLLHGKRRPEKYSKCSVCTLISCNMDTKICSGHCKRNRRLFTCRTRGRAGGVCYSVDKPNPLSLEADPLDPLRSVEIATTAPYIGCANITGLPSGCPAEGTRGMLDGELEFTVRSSSCEQYLYNLTCAEGVNITPFHPFGYCTCLIEYDGGGVALGPCSLSELKYTAPRLQDTDGVPIRVTPAGNMTMTTYGEREEVDIRTYRYDTVFELGFVSVNVEMVLWAALQNGGTNLTLDGPLEDYL